MSTQNEVAEIKKLFHALDVDKNGKLDKLEIEKVMTKLNQGVEPSGAEIAACFQDMDVNNDGVVSVDEFVSAILRWLQHSRHNASPTYQRSRLLRGDSYNEPMTKKRLIGDVLDFFHRFNAVPDFEADQKRMLSRPRGELNSESLRFAFKTYSKDTKSEYMQRVMTMIEQGGASLQIQIQQSCWSSNKQEVIIGLEQVKLLLGLLEVFHSVPDKLEFSPVFYAIFNALTSMEQFPQIRVPANQSTKQMPPIVERLIELVSAPTDTGPADSSTDVTDLQLRALNSLYLYVLGPRVPTLMAQNIWHASHHYTQKLALSRNILPRLSDVIQRNILVTQSNQELLAGVINCYGALVDGYPEMLREVKYFKVRGQITVCEILVDYLKQYSFRADVSFSLPLLRAISSTLANFCGHSTHCQHFEVDVSTIPSSFQSIDEIFVILKAVYDAVIKLYSTGLDSIDDAILIHLITTYGLIFPLIPLDALQEQCTVLVNQLFTALTKKWISPTATQIAVSRIYRTLVDVMVGKAAAAVWLFKSLDLHLSLRHHLSVDLSRTSSVLTRSAMTVVENFLDAGLEAEVVVEYYPSFLQLVRSPILRTWALHVLVNLCQPKPYLHYLLSRGYVETMMAGFTKLKVHPSVEDEYSSEVTVDLDPVYNITLILNITKALRELLKYNLTEIASTELKALTLSSFTIETVDSIRILHYLICTEFENGNLKESETDLPELLENIPSLVSAIKELHISLESSIRGAVSREVEYFMQGYETGISQSLERAHASEIAKKAKENMDVDPSDSPGRLPYLHRLSDVQDVVICLKPLWKTFDINGVAIEEKERCFLLPINTSLESLYKSVSKYYGRLVSLKTEVTTNTTLTTQTQLEESISKSLHKNADATPINAQLVFYVELSLPGEVNFHNALTILQPRETALLQVQQIAQLHGININKNLMTEVYSFFEMQRKSEINIDDFVSFMDKKLDVKELASRPLFRQFDIDNSGTISLPEMAIGLALLVEGSDDDRIIAAFNSYDADHNGFLEFDEIVHMVRVVKGITHHDAQYFTQYAFNVLQLPLNGSVNLEKFAALVKGRHLPLEYILPDIRQKYYSPINQSPQQFAKPFQQYTNPRHGTNQPFASKFFPI